MGPLSGPHPIRYAEGMVKYQIDHGSAWPVIPWKRTVGSWRTISHSASPGAVPETAKNASGHADRRSLACLSQAESYPNLDFHEGALT
jgi:hypothetical protein